MKLLVNFLFLLFLSQHATALIPWLHFRSHEEQNHADIEDRSLICKLDAVLLACKALGAQATTFCSSYLHISTATVVVPSISPTTTTTSTTSTVVTTTTTTTTATDVSTSTTTTSTTTTAPYSFGFDKRGATAKPAPAPIPPILSKFLAAEISSACSCLSIKPHTTTTTAVVPSIVTSTYTSLTTSTSSSITTFTTSTTTTTTSIFTSVVPGVCTPGGQPCDFYHPEDCCSLGCTSAFTSSSNPVCCYETSDGPNCGD